MIIVMWTEAALALACLIGLYIKDPGTVKRSPSTCSPMPETVIQRLSEGKDVDDLANIWEGEKSYCMRCLVWRDPQSDPVLDEGCAAATHDRCSRLHCGTGSRAHHCSVCERCVLNFDHHCQIFGICIAGQGCSGNIGIFHCLLSLGCAAPATAATLGILVGLYAAAKDVPWTLIVLPLWFCIILLIFRRPLFELARCRGIKPMCRCRCQCRSGCKGRRRATKAPGTQANNVGATPDSGGSASESSEQGAATV